MLQAQQDLRNDITTDLDSGDASGKRAGAVTLVGYLRHDGSDRLRLYREPGVDVYVTIRVEDVVDSSSSAGATGQSMVWVRHDAILVWIEAMSASMFDTPAGPTDGLEGGAWWPRP